MLSAYEYIIFVPAHFLLNLCEQRLSNEGDLDLSLRRRLGRAYYTGLTWGLHAEERGKRVAQSVL
jgi:hypothetical protein